MPGTNLSKILEAISYVQFIGDGNTNIEKVVALSDTSHSPTSITWSNDENLFRCQDIQAGTIICSKNVLAGNLNKNCNFIVTESPRLAFQTILKLFFSKEKVPTGIHPTATIHESARIGKSISIGCNSVIEEDVVIEDNVTIGHNTVICTGTIVRKHSSIGHNCTIGNVGFGYQKREDGLHELIPHISHVLIEEFVEIGNNTCIDRGVISPTIVGQHVKVDNLVHIAHGVEIGRNSLIIANTMIGGSSIIGEDVWVAPSSTIKNNICIGDHALLGLGTVVLKDVDKHSIIVGNPGKILKR